MVIYHPISLSLQNIHPCREEVEDEPDGLLGQVVGVAADGEQAPGDEAQAVGRLHRLPTPQLAVLLVLEVLLVRVVNINTRLFQIVIK